MMADAAYTARRIEEGWEAGKWAVFLGDEQLTKGGSQDAATGWARLRNRAAAKWAQYP